MDEKSAQMTTFIQENALWQFTSRTWDRKENLEGIFGALEGMLKKEPVPRETLAQKAFYADASVLFQQMEKAFSWFSALVPAEGLKALENARAELTDIVIVKSRNAEIHAVIY